MSGAMTWAAAVRKVPAGKEVRRPCREAPGAAAVMSVSGQQVGADEWRDGVGGGGAWRYEVERRRRKGGDRPGPGKEWT